MKLVFQFGSHPELSLAELIARFPALSTGRLVAGRFFIVESSEPPAWLLRNLGGVVKILEVIPGLSHEPDALAAHILETCTAKNKAVFGVSIINAPELKGLGIAIKRALQQESDRPVRLVVSRENELSSASVVLEKLLAPEGVELVFFKDSSEIIVAQTAAVQPFDEWSYRDYERPGRDAKRGMLPPKLAKIMVNLALGTADPTRATFYDPFCGSGTTLAEAALIGFGRVYGSDILRDAVSDAQKLALWATKEFDLNETIFEIFKQDVTVRADRIKTASIDCIVAETFLGRPLKAGESLSVAEKTDLISLYRRALLALAPLLRAPSGRVVLAIPFQMKPFELLPLDEILADTPFDIDPLLPSTSTLRYSRADQRTGRQIIRLCLK